jgi:hypothetical protein
MPILIFSSARHIEKSVASQKDASGLSPTDQLRLNRLCAVLHALIVRVVENYTDVPQRRVFVASTRVTR